MPPRTDLLDLGALSLSSGEGRRVELQVALQPLDFSGRTYVATVCPAGVALDVARLTGGGHSLRLRFNARLAGECMRCLAQASVELAVDAREVDQPGGGPQLDSPYITEDQLDVAAWARDVVVLALPAQILCLQACRGLCSVCGEDLNDADEAHDHPRAPDPRWAKLRELG